MSEPIQELIGHQMESTEVQAFLESSGETYKVQKFETFEAIELKKTGVAFTFDLKHRVYCIHLYGDEIDGFNRFRGNLPNFMQFEWSRQQVQKKMGLTAKTSSIVKQLKGDFWDLFDFPNYTLHCRYKNRGRAISMVTISAKGQIFPPQ